EVDAVPGAGEPQFDAVVAVPDRWHARRRPGLIEDLDGALLEDPGTDRRLDILATAAVDDDGVDAGDVEQMGQQQAGRAGADDGDAGAGRGHDVSFDAARGAGFS